MRESLRFLIGSGIVYVIVAACTAISSKEGGNEGAGGTTSSDGSAIDVVLDGITNPVSNAAAEVYQSGSRLRAKYYLGDDGSKQFWNWYDNKLNIDCSFVMAADGKTRCLPYQGASSYTYFSDSNCSTPLAIADCSSPGAYVITLQTVGSGCTQSNQYHVFPIGGAFSGSTVYVKGGSSCTATTTISGGWSYFTLGAEVPASSFVAATITTE